MENFNNLPVLLMKTRLFITLLVFVATMAPDARAAIFRGKNKTDADSANSALSKVPGSVVKVLRRAILLPPNLLSLRKSSKQPNRVQATPIDANPPARDQMATPYQPSARLTEIASISNRMRPPSGLTPVSGKNWRLASRGHGSLRRTVRTTAYTHTEDDHLAYGQFTAIGSVLTAKRHHTSAAADWSRFPLGTVFRIAGENTTYVIEDYGSALVGTDTIDIYRPNREAMNDWGVRHVEIEILKLGCFEQSRSFLEKSLNVPHCRQMHRSLTRFRPTEAAWPLG